MVSITRGGGLQNQGEVVSITNRVTTGVVSSNFGNNFEVVELVTDSSMDSVAKVGGHGLGFDQNRTAVTTQPRFLALDLRDRVSAEELSRRVARDKSSHYSSQSVAFVRSSFTSHSPTHNTPPRPSRPARRSPPTPTRRRSPPRSRLPHHPSLTTLSGQDPSTPLPATTLPTPPEDSLSP